MCWHNVTVTREPSSLFHQYLSLPLRRTTISASPDSGSTKVAWDIVSRRNLSSSRLPLPEST